MTPTVDRAADAKTGPTDAVALRLRQRRRLNQAAESLDPLPPAG